MSDIEFSADSFLKNLKDWVGSGGSVRTYQTKIGWSLLHCAAEFQDIPAIEYLIESGCDPNERDDYGQTPLHIAVDSEIDGAVQSQETLELRISKRLLELGSDPTIVDNHGKTAGDLASSYGERAKKSFDDVLSQVGRGEVTNES